MGTARSLTRSLTLVVSAANRSQTCVHQSQSEARTRRSRSQRRIPGPKLVAHRSDGRWEMGAACTGAPRRDPMAMTQPTPGLRHDHAHTAAEADVGAET